ncbi:MAG: tetratricopeptide repeat protein [Myxococcaceae bacterium]
MRPGLLVCVGLLLCSGVVSGASRNEKKAAGLVKQGEKLYSAGKYHEAAEALKKAYDLDPNPKLLYNIARALDQAGDLEVSLGYYRQYVGGAEDLDPSLVKRANLAMDRLRALLAKDEASKQVQDAERKRLEEDKRLAEEKAKAEADAARVQREEYEARQKAEADALAKSRSKGRTLAYVTGGVALAGLGAGVLFGLGAGSSKAAFAQAPDVAAKRGFEAETRSKALFADVGFGVAIAAAVATVIVWPKGADEPEGEVKVAVIPAPGGAGVAVSF